MITRILLTLWIAPLLLYIGWFVLSAYDLNFGTVVLSRDMHDVVMDAYANILGIDPAILPGLLARILLFDLVLIGAVMAFRRRKTIAAWWRRKRSGRAVETSEAVEMGAGEPAARSS